MKYSIWYSLCAVISFDGLFRGLRLLLKKSKDVIMSHVVAVTSYMYLFSGENISCDDGDAVFGRCSTAGNVDGACKKTSTNGKQLSHEIMCCKSKSTLDLPTCGWIYASSGTKTTCPSGFAIGGMCGVHHKDNQKCATGTAYGLECCKPKPGTSLPGFL